MGLKSAGHRPARTEFGHPYAKMSKPYLAFFHHYHNTQFLLEYSSTCDNSKCYSNLFLINKLYIYIFFFAIQFFSTIIFYTSNKTLPVTSGRNHLGSLRDGNETWRKCPGDSLPS